MHWWQALGVAAVVAYVIAALIWRLQGLLTVLSDVLRLPSLLLLYLALFGEVLLFARARLDLHSVTQQVLWGVLAAITGIAVVVLPDRLPDRPRGRKSRRVLPPDHWPE